MKKPVLVTVETVRQLMHALPGIEEGTSYGTLAFRVRNKLLARMHDDGESLVLSCADRDPLIASAPEAFYVTTHYLNYPRVLVRLSQVKYDQLQEVIEQAWRQAASTRLIKQYESGDYKPTPLEPLAMPVKPRASDEQYQSSARRICMALPEVEEKTAWNSPTFRVKGKMFAMYFNNHHGDGRIALWLKAPLGVQEMLVAAEPQKFFIPPYQGPFGWVGVTLDRIEEDEVVSLVEQAYRTVAPKKLLNLLP